MRKLALIATLVAAVIVTAPAFGSDIYPPLWRGQTGTQTVEWEFLHSATYSGSPLTGFYNPDCSIQRGWTPAFSPILRHVPGTGITPWSLTQPTAANLGSTGVTWPATPPADCGWIGLSGDVYINLPDTQVANPHKTVWMQLTWEPQSQTNIPIVTYGTDNNIDQFSAGILADHVLWVADGSDPAYPWREVHLTEYHFDFTPNPSSENIHIYGGINVDEIVVDTICYTTLPEPATLTLLGLGVAPVIWRRLRMAKK